MKYTLSGYNFHHPSDFKVERPSGCGDYLLLILRSPAYVYLNNTLHFVNKNTVIVFHKDTPQFFGANNAEFVNDWIQFDLNEEDLTFFTDIGIVFNTIMEFQDVTALSSLVEQICIERWSENKNSARSIIFLIHLIFLKISDLCTIEQTLPTRLSEQLTRLKNNIYSAPQNDWSIDTICKSMSISPSYLQHKYKQLFGNSIKYDITASRIQYSKWLLTNTSYTVAAISRMVGYENDITFMYSFKKKTGLTPSQYRNASVTYLK